MGFLSRLFVVLTVAASIGVFTWSLGVYTQRINWSNTSKDDPGIFERQKQKAQDSSSAATQALRRWATNRANVQAMEAERFPRRAFYSDQLTLLETGILKGQPVPYPVQELVSAANGYLDISKEKGRKPIEAGKDVPLDSIAGYARKTIKLGNDIKSSQTTNAEEITKREEVNREILGVREPKVIKGLRTRINEQKAIQEAAIDEETYVTGFVTNREAEFGLLKKRRDAMTARIEELKAVKVEKPQSGN